MRAAWLLLAVVAALGAVRVGTHPDAPRASWIDHWEAAHPDARPLGGPDVDLFRAMKAAERREDGASLLAALAVGALAVAAGGTWTQRLGAPRALLLFGTLALGAFHVGLSMWRQHRAGVAGEWTLGDDALFAMSPEHADTLRAWRARVPADAPVLLVGRNNFLRGIVAYALFPRPLHPIVLDVPAGMAPDDVRAMLADTALGGPGTRWVVDLRALEEGREPALLEVAP